MKGTPPPAFEPSDVASKAELRAGALRLARLRPRALADAVSRELARELFGSAPWRAASMVFSYVAILGEVPTAPILARAHREGRPVGAPCSRGERLEFRLAPRDPRSYVRGPRGVLEPPGDAPLLAPRPGDLLLVLVPGLLFDREGYRLGRGGGHYDRFLREARRSWTCFCVGLCFRDQVVSRLPREPWDERLDGLLIEGTGLALCGGPP